MSLKLTKTEWGLLSAGIAAVAVPNFIQAPVGDYLYLMPPIAMLTYIGFVYGVSKVDPKISDELNRGVKFLRKSPMTFLLTWAMLAGVTGYGLEYILEFIEPLLDVVEILLPDGYQIAWILSPYSPYFLALTAAFTFVVCLVTTGITAYTFMAIQSFLHSVVNWDMFQVDDPHFYHQGSPYGGRDDKPNGGSDYGYGLAHLPRDVFQFLTASPITFVSAMYETIQSVAKGSPDVLPLVFAPLTIASYMFRRFGDIVLDCRFLTKDIKLTRWICLKDFLSVPPNPFSPSFKVDDYRINCN